VADKNNHKTHLDHIRQIYRDEGYKPGDRFDKKVVKHGSITYNQWTEIDETGLPFSSSKPIFKDKKPNGTTKAQEFKKRYGK
tara:strand:- start:356 stop:601 length:246 start_codon:yes stop_codon:yes gene_type:complete